jgi:hypothetical protein
LPATGSFPAEPPVLAPLPTESAQPTTAAAAPVPRAAPAAALAKPSNPSQKKPEDAPAEPSHDGLFGPFRIGVLVGVGIPSSFAFAGELRLTRYFGAGVRFGFIPNVQFSYYGEAKVSYQDYGAYAHVHPFGGGFLFGAEIGYAHANGSYTSSIDTSKYVALGAPPSIDVTTNGSVEMLVLTPEVGYVFTWRAGFTFGFDVGAQIPIASSNVTLADHVVAPGLPQSVVDGFFAPDEEKVRSTLEKVGQTVLPAAHIRIGWLL